DLPGLDSVVVGVRQPLKVVVNGVADVVRDLLADRLAQVLLAKEREPLANREHDDPGAAQHQQPDVAVQHDVGRLADRMQAEVDGVANEEWADHREHARKEDRRESQDKRPLERLEEMEKAKKVTHRPPSTCERLAHLNAKVKL